MYLRYNYEADRFGVWDGSEWYIEGLHCGMTFAVKYRGQWVPTRIEFSDDWYLVGIPDDVPMNGLEVKFGRE